jgi:hypothetical protein
VPSHTLAVEHRAFTRTNGPGTHALVVAIDRDVLGRVTDRFQAAGVEVKGCTVAPLAALQCVFGSLALPPAVPAAEGRKPCGLFVDVGESGTDLVAWTDKGPVQLRSLRRGTRALSVAVARAFGTDTNAAATLMREAGLVPAELQQGRQVLQTPDGRTTDVVLQQALEPLLREIEHMRMWLRTELGLEVAALQLAGGGALLPGIVEWLSGSLGTPVVRAEPSPRVLSLAKPLPSVAAVGAGPLPGASMPAGPVWARTLVAAGAATSAHRKPFLRFEAGAHARAEEGFLVQHFGTVFALGLALVGLFGIDTILRIRALERERTNVQEELSAISARVFGEALEDPEAVDGLLASLDQDVVEEEIPARGALEVLEMIARVAAPKDGTPQAQPAPTPDPTAAAGSTGDGATPPVDGAGDGGSGDAGTPSAPTEVAGSGNPEAPGGPIPLEAGIVLSDALEFASIDVRAIKIEMKVSATRAGAQDRLALQLEKIGCIRNITKGRIVDRNERKVFEMSMDHDCFTKTLGADGETEGMGS